MKQSPSIKELATALAACQAELKVAEFDSTNPFLKNRYASLGSVIASSRPALAKHGLAIAQFPVSNDKSEIGVDSILTHASGEWLSEALFLPLSEEKGKSRAQAAGSTFTYLKRYAWSSILGMYADEDQDGNDDGHDHGSRPGNSPRSDPGRSGGPSSQGGTRSTQPAASSAPATTTRADSTAVAELRKRLGPNVAEFERCLQNRTVNAQGQVVLIGPLVDLSDAWANLFLKNFDTEMAKVEMWIQENPPAGGAASSAPVEVSRDENMDPHSPDAPWRAFPMPWGDKKGQPLGKLEVKYLFGLWANYEGKPTTTQGRQKTDAELTADRKFRAMLDEAGKHYDFHK